MSALGVLNITNGYQDENLFSVRLLDAASLMEEEMTVDGRVYDSRIQQSYDEWVEQWRYNIPQRTIFEQKLPRDRWVPLRIPTTFSGIAEQFNRPEVQKHLQVITRSLCFFLCAFRSSHVRCQDPQQRNYWIYSSGRTVFFFLSSVLTGPRLFFPASALVGPRC